MNETIKAYAASKNIKFYRIAEVIGITENTFSRKMRTEFNQEQVKTLKSIINCLASGKEYEKNVRSMFIADHRGGELSGEEDEYRMSLYKKGKCDVEISSLCKVSVSSILQWRQKHSLKPNKRKNRHTVYSDDWDKDFKNKAFYEV